MVEWHSREYVPVKSFESTPNSAGAAGEKIVAIGTRLGTVHIIRSDEQSAFHHDSEIIDIAVGELLYVLTSKSLSAYSRNGSQHWQVEISTPEQVTLIREDGIVVVGTESGELIGYRVDRGIESFRIQRPKSDIEFEPEYVSYKQQLFIATWSFVTVLDSAGETVDEFQCDGTISAIEAIDETLVVFFNDDRVVGIDLNTEEILWRRELSIKSQPHRCEGEVVFLTGNGIRSLSPDGELIGVSPNSADDLYIGLNGEPLCLITGETASIYRKPGSAGSALTASVKSGALTMKEDCPLPISIKNGAEWAVDTHVTLSGEGIDFDANEVPINIRPGEKIRIEPTVSLTTERPDPSLTLTCEESELLSATLKYRPESVLELEPTIEEIRDGIARLSTIIKNTGQTELVDVSVSPNNTTVEILNPEEERRLEAMLPFQADSTVAITATGQAGQTLVESSVDFPPAPVSVSVSVTEMGVLEILARNSSAIPISDRLSVSGDPIASIEERSIELDGNSECKLTIRPNRLTGQTGTILVTIPGLDTEHRKDIGASEVAPIKRTEKVQISEEYHSPQEVTSSGEQASVPGRSSTRSTPATSDPRESTRKSAQPAKINAQRDIDDDPISSQRVLEIISLENNSSNPASNVTYRSGATVVSVDNIPAGESRRLRRSHVFRESDTVEVEGGIVVTPDGTVDQFGRWEADLSKGEIAVEGKVFEPEDSLSKVTVRIQNMRDVPCSLERIVFETGDVWRTDMASLVERSGTTERSGEIHDSSLSSRVAIETRFDYVFEDRDDIEHVTTLLPLNGTSKDPIQDLVVATSYQTRITQGQGSVTLSLTNTGNQSMTDVVIEAIGKDVDTRVYRPENFDSIEQGEKLEHTVDIQTDQDSIDIAVRLQATVGGSERTEIATIQGPVGRGSGWHKSLLDEWMVRRAAGTKEFQSGQIMTEFRELTTDGNTSRIPDVEPIEIESDDSSESSPGERDPNDVTESGRTDAQNRPEERVQTTRVRSNPSVKDRTDANNVQRISGGTECPNCGEEVPNGANFCPYCEVELDESDSAAATVGGDPKPTDVVDLQSEEKTEDCAFCGKDIPAGANYCPYCEAKLGETSSAKTGHDYCEYCGIEVGAETRWCPECDAKLGD